MWKSQIWSQLAPDISEMDKMKAYLAAAEMALSAQSLKDEGPELAGNLAAGLPVGMVGKTDDILGAASKADDMLPGPAPRGIMEFRKKLKAYNAALKKYEEVLYRRGVKPEQIPERIKALRKASRPELMKDFRQDVLTPKPLLERMRPSHTIKQGAKAWGAEQARDNIVEGPPEDPKDTMQWKLLDYIFGRLYD
jgi:hypothetical protein